MAGDVLRNDERKNGVVYDAGPADLITLWTAWSPIRDCIPQAFACSIQH